MTEFSVTTREIQENYQVILGSRPKILNWDCSPVSSVKKPSNSPRVLSELSITEVELSKEYTCVISHGPNPKTTNIFDDYVTESCYGDVGGGGNEKKCLSKPSISYPSDDFLSFCYNCKKNLNQGNDIYIYGCEKAFCCNECRYKEMMKEGPEMMNFADMYDTSS